MNPEKMEQRGRMIDALRYAMKQPNACISIKEVAALIGVSTLTIANMTKDGRFTVPRMPMSSRSKVFFRVKDVIAWLNSAHES